MQAGFDRSQMLIGAGATVYTEPDETRWRADVHVGGLEGEIGERWIRDKDVKSQEEIENLKTALTVCGERDQAWYTTWSGEAICWK
ncbi:hypothetical protein LTR66_001715 [Elasticomyces elasticus]|nr:hypothetical protein LTR66_001715 [Elasticomyces elasticus]